MGEDAALKDMAAQLAAMLQVQGEKGREAWSQLHGKLAEVAAAAVADPITAVQALVKEALTGNSDSDALRRVLEERARDVSKANPDLLKHLILLVAEKLNMVPLGDSKPVHMIDGDKIFCEEDVGRIIKCSADLSAPNAPYAVVSIVGAQSSGKSYLLNHLFGTKFPVMDAKYGRRQTTRGIMVARCIGPSLLLLDIEGFDGREKGQDTSFDNQAALLALTISDLMMINMSVFDVGREQGGATLLFKIVFQERTKLPPGLTKILVVLRLYDGETPIEVLKSDVVKSLEKIWESVNVESVKFKDYIEVNVIGLPDKNSPEFPQEVKVLRKLVSNNRGAKVPASSFSVSSRMYWEDIKQNKKLNIPSHQVAIANMYCQGLVEDALNSLHSQEEYKLLKAEESPQGFKEISDALFTRITTKYDLETEMYDREVRNKERQNLVEKLNEIFKHDSRKLIQKMQDKTSEQFKSNIKIDEKTTALDRDQMVDACVTKFMSSCEELKVFHSEHYDSIRIQLQEELKSYTSHQIFEKQEECDKKGKQIRRELLIKEGAEVVGSAVGSAAVLAALVIVKALTNSNS